jgi:hypothetical protein
MLNIPISLHEIHYLCMPLILHEEFRVFNILCQKAKRNVKCLNLALIFTNVVQ